MMSENWMKLMEIIRAVSCMTCKLYDTSQEEFWDMLTGSCEMKLIGVSRELKL